MGNWTRRGTMIAATGAPLLAGQALAAWPDRPIRLIVPFAAGGNVDVMARCVAEPMSARLGRPVTVDNRAGGGGAIGAEAAARAQPDGYTLFAGSGGTLVANPVLQARLAYDAEKDFRPIGLIGRVPVVLSLGPKERSAGWPEFLARAKAEPDRVTVATGGVGSTAHLALELLNLATGARFSHVPYRGGGSLVADLLAGNFDAALFELTTALPLHQERQARVVAVAAEQRAVQLPGIPTFIELGVPGFTSTSFGGLLAPARTPAEVTETLQAALVAALAEPSVRTRLESLGATAASGPDATPAGFAAFLREELSRARRAAELAGLKPE